jgi:regulator of sigma E protease
MIKGKPLSDKFLERAQIVGFVLLISLMVFAFGNDIVKQVMKK